jgi:hypothetical protein
MPLRIFIACDIDGHVQSYVMDVENIAGICRNSILDIKTVIFLPNAELLLEILTEVE